jgi:2-polyprenyl-6-methoxyphenol hydroxylase-like FAD-dependent oxidoreductase
MRGREADGMRVAVAGGSIGGLAAATALQSVGCAVEVYERTPHQMTSRGAGIVVQPSLTALLSQVGASSLPTTRCTHRNYLSPNRGRSELSLMPQRFTSWEAIYKTLLAAFPAESYHLGAEMAGFNQASNSSSVSVRLADGRTAEADLLVCADGWRSATRRHFLPQASPRYASYIAWRGTLSESEVSADLVSFFDDRFTFSDARSGGHALCYFIPGDDARTEPGQRRLNWVWYVHVPEGSDLDRILTERTGERRAGSVSPGLLDDEVAEEMRRAAARELHPQFAELIAATPEPFVQVILDLAVPRMRFGRVCLVGDAAFIVRPHTAGATAKAADDARALALAAKAWRGNLNDELAHWEANQLSAGRAMAQYGMALGKRFASAG